MNKTLLTTPNGERFVIVPEAEFERLLEAAEDIADVTAYDRAKARVENGEEMVPAEFANRLLDEPRNRLRIWREYRGLSATALAERAGISGAYLSEIETGKKSGSVAALKKIAEALHVDLDDIA
jgi:DNA-binding XRE family transcriptional regulator